MERRCEFEGCANVGHWSKKVGYKLFRSKFCKKHHMNKYSMKRGKQKEGMLARARKKFANKVCSICGWDKANCDLHRVVNGKDGGTYSTKNIVPLCPNCHRLIHLGKIELK